MNVDISQHIVLDGKIDSYLLTCSPCSRVQVLRLIGTWSKRIQVQKSFLITWKYFEKAATSMNFIIKVILPSSSWSSSWICTRRYFPIRFWVKRQNKKLSNRHELCFILWSAKVPSIPQTYSSELSGCCIGNMTILKLKDIFVL